MESESEAVSDSVTMVSKTVGSVSDDSISYVQAEEYRNSILDISSRLEVRLQKLAEEINKMVDETDISAFNSKYFVSLQRSRLH